MKQQSFSSFNADSIEESARLYWGIEQVGGNYLQISSGCVNKLGDNLKITGNLEIIE